MAVRPLAGASVEIGLVAKHGATSNALVNELATFLRSAAAA
jgi:hypothetical protein